MNWTSDQKEVARKLVKRMGDTVSPGTLSFFLKRHLGISPSIEDVKVLLDEVRTPAPQTSSTPLAKTRSQSNIRDLCMDIINETKEELSSLEAKRYDPYHTTDGITPILCLSDLHFGEVIEFNGKTIFNMDIARAGFQDIITQAIESKELASYEVDEFVVLLAGDILDGELIFPAQAFETDGDVYSQLKRAHSEIWSALIRLSEAFGLVKVYCVPGNHGRTSKLHSQMSNWDNVLYWGLQLTASMQDDFPIEVHTPHQMWMDFKVRNWNIHTRHIGVSQAATASPAKKVMTWMENHDADLFFYGHFHNPEMYSHGYKRIFKNGSLPPANEFAERLGFKSSCGQWLIGVTDDNPVAFSKILIP